MAKPHPRWEKVSGQCIQHRIKQVQKILCPTTALAASPGASVST